MQRTQAEIDALILQAETRARRNRERQQAWYARNAEKKRAYAKEWYKQRKAEAAAQQSEEADGAAKTPGGSQD